VGAREKWGSECGTYFAPVVTDTVFRVIPPDGPPVNVPLGCRVLRILFGGKARQ